MILPIILPKIHTRRIFFNNLRFKFTISIPRDIYWNSASFWFKNLCTVAISGILSRIRLISLRVTNLTFNLSFKHLRSGFTKHILETFIYVFDRLRLIKFNKFLNSTLRFVSVLILAIIKIPPDWLYTISIQRYYYTQNYLQS